LDEISIDAENISKQFIIYHDRASTVFEYVNSLLFRKKQSEKLDILHDVSFKVKKGEMLGIIGFNGSGKTTLLKIIANIMKPNSGKITVSGKVIPLLELGTGFNGELTAKENILLYGLLLGFKKKEIENKVQEIIKFAELEKFLDTKLKNFSSGMYARLAFSTAIQVNPDILLVDEVLSVGDISFQEKSFKKFHEFKEQNKTIIFVSHNIEQVREICDKVMWIDKGKIKLIGEPSKVIDEFVLFSNSQNK
jgi:ABC-type polysaccharide/polyol phosphate transport system ATPase subunit